MPPNSPALPTELAMAARWLGDLTLADRLDNVRNFPPVLLLVLTSVCLALSFLAHAAVVVSSGLAE